MATCCSHIQKAKIEPTSESRWDERPRKIEELLAGVGWSVVRPPDESPEESPAALIYHRKRFFKREAHYCPRAISPQTWQANEILQVSWDPTSMFVDENSRGMQQSVGSLHQTQRPEDRTNLRLACPR